MIQKNKKEFVDENKRPYEGDKDIFNRVVIS